MKASVKPIKEKQDEKVGKILYEIKSNPIGKILLQLICLLLILKIVLHFNENPLGAVISISFLLIIIFSLTEKQTIVYENHIVFLTKRTLPILSSKYVVCLEDVDSLEIEKSKIFYPSLLLGPLFSKNARLVIYFKNGTFKEIILWGRTKKYMKMIQIVSERLN